MSVWIVTTKSSSNIVAVYSSYSVASQKFNISQYDIKRWYVE